MKRFIVFLVGCCAVGVGLLLAAAFFWPTDSAQQAALANELLDVDAFQDLIRQGVLAGLKPEYQSQHHWGEQATVKRLKLKGRWYAPRVENVEKQVNDGNWQRFVVSMVEPDQSLQTRVEPVRSQDDGSFLFTLSLSARVHGRGQFERWEKGIRLYDVSAEANLTVAARVECSVTVRPSPDSSTEVVVDPQVTAIQLELQDLDVERIGKLGQRGVGSELAQQLGDALRPTIEHELRRREPKLIEKANASIDKRRDRLTFSLAGLATSGWSRIGDMLAGRPASGAR